jgi:hypothetical protein
MANETIVLTTPVAQPALSGYAPGSLLKQLLPTPRFVVTIIRSDGVGEVFEYPASGTLYDTPAKVATAIEALNSANHTGRSEWQKIMDGLKRDFPTRFPGAVTVP